MTITNEEIKELRQLCPHVYSSNDEAFADKAAPWSIWADRKPQLAVEPTNIETMQAVVKYLYAHNSIDFCIRNTGTGGSSATDVVLSMHGFKELAFDPEDESVVVGAGLSWGGVDRLMDEKTDGYGCVSARCTWVGVTGMTITAGKCPSCLEKHADLLSLCRWNNGGRSELVEPRAWLDFRPSKLA